MDTFKFPEVLPFDIELAKLAIAVGTGKIITRDYHDAVITNLWKAESFDSPYPIQGDVIIDNASYSMCWTLEGKRYATNTDRWDLMIIEM